MDSLPVPVFATPVAPSATPPSCLFLSFPRRPDMLVDCWVFEGGYLAVS